MSLPTYVGVAACVHGCPVWRGLPPFQESCASSKETG